MIGLGANPWRAAFVAVIAATSVACISSSRYPAGWANPVPTVNHDCPDVSGVYSNRGEVQPGAAEASLNVFLRLGIPLLAVTQVELTRSDRFLDISLWSDGKVSERRRLELGVGFKCGAKGLELLERGYSSSDSAVGVGGSFSWGKVWMTRGEDRSLVVHTVDNDLAILILVPLYGQQTLWYRFPVAEGADARQDRGVLSPAPVSAVGEAARHASLDEVLARTIESSGGSDAWKAVESERITGRMVDFDGKQGSFRLEIKRPNKWRREVSVKGGTEITAFDGEAGWILHAKRTKPKAMKPWEIGVIGLDVLFFGPLLIDDNTGGDKFELVSEESVDGTAAYTIKATRDSPPGSAALS